MIKMTRNQIDKYFLAIAHDLYSKFDENCTIIHDTLLPTSEGRIAPEIMFQIRERLLVEFGVIVAEQQAKGIKDATKSKAKAKKKVTKKVDTTTKKLVRPKKKQRGSAVDKSS